MKRFLFVLCLLTVAAKPAPFNPAWEKLKTLAGDWKAKDGTKISFKLVSGGTALMESMAMGEGADMITVYHPNGGKVLATHYCALGNQPRLRTAGFGKEGTLEFDFVDATNLSSPKAERMSRLVMAFPDENRLIENWTSTKAGKASSHVKLELTRVAP